MYKRQDGGRDKDQIIAVPFLERLNQDGEKSDFGEDQFAAAASASLDEKFQGMPLLKEGRDVSGKYGGVEPGALETSADKKGPRFSEKRPHGPEGKVFARSDSGDMHVVQIEGMVEHQVIDVAFVGWDIDDRAFSAAFPYGGQFIWIHVNALKHLFPEPRQHDVGELDVGDIVIRGDLIKIGGSLFSYMLQPGRVSRAFSLNSVYNRWVFKNFLLKLLSRLDDRAQDHPLLLINAVKEELSHFSGHRLRRVFLRAGIHPAL